jgi:hypothetical protein
VVIISGSTLQNAALKKSIPLPNRDMVATSMIGPGNSSSRVGHSFLKIVVGFAMNPWGRRSRKKCESNDTPVTIAYCCRLPEAVVTVNVVIRQEAVMCVVAVMGFFERW